MVKKIIIYNHKISKFSSNEILEIDKNDLEIFGHFIHDKNFLQIPSLKINNKTLIDWFSIDNFSAWWFAAPIIHPKYKEGIMFIEKFLEILKKYNPESLVLKGCFDKLDLIKQICVSKNISLIISKNDYAKYQIKHKIIEIIKKRAYQKILKNKNAKRLKSSKIKSMPKLPSSYTLFVSPGIYRRKTIIPPSSMPQNSEFYIQPFLDFLNSNKIPSFCIDLDYTFKGETKTLIERQATENSWIPIELLLNNSFSSKNQQVMKKLKKSIDELLINDLSHIFTYKGISLSQFIKPEFKILSFAPYFPMYFHILEEFEKFLSKNPPSQIIQLYEAGPCAKSIEIAAKNLKIKTISIQHGLIPSDYPDYMAKEIRTYKNNFGNVIPDSTLVYGPFYEKLLTETGNYPNNSVLSIGNPTYYEINEIKNILKTKEIFDKNILAKKIILVPLSFRLLKNKNTPDLKILQILFENFKNSSSVQILVRPHPGDNLSTSKLNELFPNGNFICSENSLFEDIFVSDIVVILPTSTVSTDAAMFEKPIILVNIFENNDMINDVYMELIKNEVAILSNLSNLPTEIKLINKNTLWYTSNSEKRKNFMENFFNSNVKPNFSEILELN